MATHSNDTPTVNRTLGYVFGAVYVLVGLAGFGVTNGLPFLAREGKPLVIFDVNPLHNVVHLGIGALLILAAMSGLAAAKKANTFVGAVYLVTGLLGLYLVGNKDSNILAINTADNFLHFASAILLLGVGLYADRHVTTTTTSPDAATRSPRARM